MKISKILSLIVIAFFLNFSFASADFSSFSSRLSEKISQILQLRENEKTTIKDATKVIQEWKANPDLEVLEKISSCDVLNEIIKKNQNNVYPILYRWIWWWIMEDAVMETGESVSTKSVSQSLNSSDWDYSKTNIQVEWVDEWDIVKNDWRFIYILSNTKKSVKIFDTEKSEKIAEIPFSDENFYWQEIYISEWENKKLVLIWNWWEEPEWDKKISEKFYLPGKNYVKIFSYDLKNLWTDDKVLASGWKFSSERKIFFEWEFAKSRLIWEELYLITKKYSRNFYFYDEQENAWEDNIPLIIDWWKSSKIAKCWEVEFFPWSEETDFVIVSKIDLSDKNSEIEKKIFLWDLENIYMSQKNLYIAAWTKSKDWNFWNWDATQIVKFSLEDLELKNIWKVEWRILNQFSMDEFDWNFRIATTDRDLETEEIEKGEWDEKTTIIRQNTVPKNNLFILNEDLEEVWKIEWIAKWEQIKSVRFMWNRAFVVTFENIDPFFVLDLSDSQNPKILWELKIPGWSDYLHPFWENYILWFWKDAKAPESEDESFSWKDVEWMKVSLFDITDLSDPKEKFTWEVWERWTTSEVLNDHKWLFFEENEDSAILWFNLHEKNTIEFEQKNCFEYTYSDCPINVCQKRCTPTWPDFIDWDCDWPWSCVYQRQYEWYNIRSTFAWAVFLEISKENWFEELKRISNFTEDELLENRYFWEFPERKISRIVRIWDKYFWISEDVVIEISENFSKENNFIIK